MFLAHMPDPATSTTTPLPVQQSVHALSTIPFEEYIAPGAITSAGEFVPDPSPATRHDTLPTVTDAGLLVRTAAEALHFHLELLSLLVRELGGDWSATTISELTTISSSDVESAIRGLEFDGVAIRPLQRGTLMRVLAISAASRGVSPSSAMCTFATASTHTDVCHSNVHRGGTEEDGQRGRVECRRSQTWSPAGPKHTSQTRLGELSALDPIAAGVG